MSVGQPRGPGVQHGVRDVLLPSGRHHSASTRLASRDRPGAQGQAGVGVGDQRRPRGPEHSLSSAGRRPPSSLGQCGQHMWGLLQGRPSVHGCGGAPGQGERWEKCCHEVQNQAHLSDYLQRVEKGLQNPGSLPGGAGFVLSLNGSIGF